VAEGIKVSFGLKVVLDIERLEIRDGDKIGLVGENGAGKTTLLNVLSGAKAPDEGQARALCPVAMIRQDRRDAPGEASKELQSRFHAPAMGLTNWSGKIVTAKESRIAKNYLHELELKRLELLVEQFLVYAELRAVEKRPMYMQQWVDKLDEFLRFNEKEVLQHKGKVSRQDMEAKVREELQKYHQQPQSLEAGNG
jgi:ATPase subunit of ABC transporter with duplicated ATPase domains